MYNSSHSKSKQEMEWEAESDARALVRLAAMKKDPKRLKRAKKALKTIKDEHEEGLSDTVFAEKMAKAFPEK